MFTMCTAVRRAQPLTHADIPRLRDATEQWRYERRPLPNRTKLMNFSESDLINDDSTFARKFF